MAHRTAVMELMKIATVHLVSTFVAFHNVLVQCVFVFVLFYLLFCTCVFVVLVQGAHLEKCNVQIGVVWTLDAGVMDTGIAQMAMTSRDVQHLHQDQDRLNLLGLVCGVMCGPGVKHYT